MLVGFVAIVLAVVLVLWLRPRMERPERLDRREVPRMKRLSDKVHRDGALPFE